MFKKVFVFIKLFMSYQPETSFLFVYCDLDLNILTIDLACSLMMEHLCTNNC